MASLDMSQSAAWESQALEKLRLAAGHHPQQQARQVAQQVEGLFVQIMLKSMRQALPKEGIFSSQQTALYTSLYDQQIGQLASKQGVGLAPIIEQQLLPQRPLDEHAGTVAMPLGPERLVTTQSTALSALIDKAINHFEQPASAYPDFLAELHQPAQIVSLRTGIPQQLILAQAALESGWGQRQIRTAQGKPSYNLFGIKADASWHGPATEITTTEYHQGVAQKVTARFRVYPSWQQALEDYARLLTNNQRYHPVTQAKSAEQGALALHAAGYATDPQYADKLIKIIKQIKSTLLPRSQSLAREFEKLF